MRREVNSSVYVQETSEAAEIKMFLGNYDL